MNPEALTVIETREQALARIREILIQKLHVRRAPDEIDPDTPLFGTGLGLDSVDAVDLHVYHPTGGLPSRADLPVDIGSLPLWAGECGCLESGDDDAQHQLNYLFNARTLGYDAAFLWKLQGARHLVRVRERAATDGWRFETTALGGKVQDLLRRRWTEP